MPVLGALLVAPGVVLVVGVTVARLFDALFPGGFGLQDVRPSWFAEQVEPIADDLTAGRPVTKVDQRQYGPAALLIIEPVLRLAGLGPLMNIYVALIGLACTVGAYILVGRRYAADRRQWLMLAALWSNAAPLLISLRGRSIDVWQLFFVSLGLYLFTRPAGASPLSAVPLMAGALTKLLPAFLFVYVAAHGARIALIGALAGVVIIGLGDVLLGPALGLGYPSAIVGGLETSAARFAIQWENNSLLGLAQKVASGFRVEPAVTGLNSGYLVVTEYTPIAALVARILAVALVSYLAWCAWKGRANRTPARRSFEFGFAIVTMLLVSPQTSHEYMTMGMPAFAVLAFLWTQGIPTRWPPGLTALAVASVALVCVFVPLSVAVGVLQLDDLWVATGNGGLGPTAAVGIYQHFGLPAVGLVLAWVCFALLDRRWAHI